MLLDTVQATTKVTGLFIVTHYLPAQKMGIADLLAVLERFSPVLQI